MIAKINKSKRISNKRPHTTTHLLHTMISKIIPNTRQAWSWVWNDELRFDFSSDRLFDFYELKKIESDINQIIIDSVDVTTQEMKIDDAIKIWAKAFFGDKYGEYVRVVKITNDQSIISTELCGWTHVSNTSEIWSFVITWQEAVASWIKRITWFTWPKVLDFVNEKRTILNQIWQKIQSKSDKQILEKVDKFLFDFDLLNKKIEKFENIIIDWILNIEDLNWNELFDIVLDESMYNFLSQLDTKKLINWLQKFNWKTIFIKFSDNRFVIISNNLSKSAKQIAIDLWYKWWWNENVFQGKIS